MISFEDGVAMLLKCGWRVRFEPLADGVHCLAETLHPVPISSQAFGNTAGEALANLYRHHSLASNQQGPTGG